MSGAGLIKLGSMLVFKLAAIEPSCVYVAVHVGNDNWLYIVDDRVMMARRVVDMFDTGTWSCDIIDPCGDQASMDTLSAP